MDSTTHATPEIDPRDKKKFYFTDTPQRRALVAMARSLFNLVMVMDVTGLENFPPQGPVILAANHVTNFDVFPMQDGRRSIGFRLTFQADDRTLTDEEVNAIHGRVARRVCDALGLTLRGA